MLLSYSETTVEVALLRPRPHLHRNFAASRSIEEGRYKSKTVDGRFCKALGSCPSWPQALRVMQVMRTSERREERRRRNGAVDKGSVTEPIG